MTRWPLRSWPSRRARSAPVVAPVGADRRTLEQKMSWILRLEDQRILRLGAAAGAAAAAPVRADEGAPAPPPPPPW